MRIEELAALAQSGDRGAREALVEQAAGLVYARVLRQLKGRVDAEDVAQEALLRALEALPRLRRPEAFLGWLKRITDNALASHWRSLRSREDDCSAASQQPAAPVSSADERLEIAEERRRMRVCLADMRPRSRLAVELFYFHELTSREVAEFLRTSDEAVRATLTRSRRDLKRRLTTMACMDERAPTIRFSIASGSARGPVFGHESATARLYLALYPHGDSESAAATAGLSAEEADRELSWLRSTRLVVADGDSLRCTAPVASEIDVELMRLWAEPVVGLVIEQLGELQQSARHAADSVQGELAQSTVMAVSAAEAARRPFAGLRAQLGDSAPERGPLGRLGAAMSTCEIPDARVLRGYHISGHTSGDGGDLYHYYLHPSGTSREAVDALIRDGELLQQRGTERNHELAGLVQRAVHDGITDSLLDELGALLSVPLGRRQELWDSLCRLGALRRCDGRTVVTLPVVPVATWQAYLAGLDRVGERVCAQIVDAADGLRARAARCSFADCCFSDSVMLFFAVAESMVGAAIDEAGWVELPGEADLSWGVMLAA